MPVVGEPLPYITAAEQQASPRTLRDRQTMHSHTLLHDITYFYPGIIPFNVKNSSNYLACIFLPEKAEFSLITFFYTFDFYIPNKHFLS